MIASDLLTIAAGAPSRWPEQETDLETCDPIVYDICCHGLVDLGPLRLLGCGICHLQILQVTPLPGLQIIRSGVRIRHRVHAADIP
ncbi:hypothetical protein CSAL01_12460 [Colletotrichum salicis]|uniref:Uncharacterized protein n=1 Tax=Colletotrichum salicis TaxID=1209931 RepID=A0A135V0S3_9PEZI|nr:hypothetical protein CSAL01_12460 [Colletotrichum salicis]